MSSRYRRGPDFPAWLAERCLCTSRIGRALAAIGLLCTAAFVHAQQPADDYPSKPVTINIPFDTGSAHDILMRPYIQSIRERTGKTFVVAFRPGAGTTIGMAWVAKAAPDGYNILTTSPAVAIAPSVYPDLPFDPLKDLAPISLLSKRAFALVVAANTPYRTLQEYLAYARAHPGEINWGASGAGSATHLPGEYLHHMTGTKVTFIQYKSSAQRVIDLVAGRVQVTMASFSNVLGHVKAGKLRALAVTTNRRTADWPDLPTIDEQGVKGYEFSTWLGLWAPARTPAPIIQKLNGYFNEANKDPLVRRTEEDGNILVGTTPEQLRQHMAGEAELWRRLIREAGLKFDAM